MAIFSGSGNRCSANGAKQKQKQCTANQSKTLCSKANSSRANHSNAKHGKAEHIKATHCRAKQNTAKHSEGKQGIAKSSIASHSKVSGSRTKQSIAKHSISKKAQQILRSTAKHNKAYEGQKNIKVSNVHAGVSLVLEHIKGSGCP